MGNRQSILLVDDQSANLVALRTALSSLDVDFVDASSGNEALKATLNHDFAAAVLDVQMPEMDGYELAEILRDEPRTRSLPMLFLSAVHRETFHAFRGYQAGAVDFLTKPIQAEVLVNKLKFFLLLDSQRRSLLDKLSIQESESSLQSILSSMSEAVFVTTPSGIATVNSAAEQLLGYSAVELMGESIRSILASPVEELQVGEEYDDCAVRTKEGSEVPVRISISQLKDRDGQLLMVTDLREKKEDQKAREELQARLSHAQRLESLGRLAGGVAHDLNNLLTVVQTCSSLALENSQSLPVVREELSQSLAASRKAEMLVRELLAIGRKQVLQPETIHLQKNLREACSLLDRLLGDHIEILQVHSPEPIYTRVDPVQLNQVIMNLAVNARDAMGDGGRLTVSSDLLHDEKLGSRARIRVSDSGSGIPEEVQEKMFDPFYTTKDVDGTGLGLAVVHGIVAQSGGGISVESEENVGSCFTILLDSAEPPVEERDEVESERSSGVRTGTGTVLLVEDDMMVQRALKRVLERNGFSVQTASSWEQANELSRRINQLAALITDINLPDHNGIKVATSLREVFPEVPILFMSGNPGGLLERDDLPSTPVNFLQKPFLPETFLEKVLETCHLSLEKPIREAQ
ncbi:MAG: response regulator [Polyangiaceae bacterium]|nr:response regulator [Polyangiaceae bacterium]